MHAPVVVLVDPRGRVCARHARTRERVAAQVGAARLDHALADGAEPESDPVLALRAGRLASAHTRLVYARSVRRILRAADVPGSLIAAHSSAVRLDRVTRAHRELELLVDRLTASAPVSTSSTSSATGISGACAAAYSIAYACASFDDERKNPTTMS